MSGYFESSQGNKSSTRLIGFMVVLAALIFAQEVIIASWGNIIVGAASAGTIFLTIAAPVLTYMYQQKKNENSGQL